MEIYKGREFKIDNGWDVLKEAEIWLRLQRMKLVYESKVLSLTINIEQVIQLTIDIQHIPFPKLIINQLVELSK